MVDLQVFASPRITLKPLVPSFPCFANIYVSLMDKVGDFFFLFPFLISCRSLVYLLALLYMDTWMIELPLLAQHVTWTVHFSC